MLKLTITNKQGAFSTFDLATQYYHMRDKFEEAELGVYPFSVTVEEMQKEGSRLKLSADSDMGNGLLRLLDPKATLYGVYFLDESMKSVHEAIKEDIEQNVVNEQYSTQDELNGIPFVQKEGDRLGLCFILDYYDDIEAQIKGLQSTKTITAEKEHEKEVAETTDAITAEDIVEQAVYMANAPDCCADRQAENMLSMLGANIIDESIYHDEDECPNIKQAVIDSVKEEYDLYEKELLQGTPESVYAHSHETTVKSYLLDTICEEYEFDDDIYRALYEDKGKILRDLHEDYTGEKEASMATLGDRVEFIEDYCHRYHADIMLGNTEGTLTMN